MVCFWFGENLQTKISLKALKSLRAKFFTENVLENMRKASINHARSDRRDKAFLKCDRFEKKSHEGGMCLIISRMFSNKKRNCLELFFPQLALASFFNQFFDLE